MIVIERTIRTNEAPPKNERPRCPWCNKTLRPMFETVGTAKITTGNGWTTQDTQEWKGRYYGYGAFDTLRCCEAYANDRVKTLPRLRIGAVTKAELDNIAERITLSQLDELKERFP